MKHRLFIHHGFHSVSISFVVCVLISACGSEPVSASEITFACTWACVFSSCESVGESGGDAELCGCSCAHLAMAVAPGWLFGTSSTEALFLPRTASGSLRLLLLQGDPN